MLTFLETRSKPLALTLCYFVLHPIISLPLMALGGLGPIFALIVTPLFFVCHAPLLLALRLARLPALWQCLHIVSILLALPAILGQLYLLYRLTDNIAGDRHDPALFLHYLWDIDLIPLVLINCVVGFFVGFTLRIKREPDR